MVQVDSDCGVRDQLRIDGIQYEITASHVDQGICRATWKCSVCNDQGTWVSLAAVPSEAIQMAKSGIDVHHAFLHGRSLTQGHS